MATEGLDKVTMRTVAEKAGVSLRLVQYYFGTKSQLLQHTLAHLENESQQRWRHRLDMLGRATTPRDILEAYLDEALPTDAASREFHTVYRAFTAAALTDPALTTEALSAGPRRVHHEITDLIGRVHDTVFVDRGTDPATEAHHLMALEHGLSTGILIGLYDCRTARSILSKHLNQLMPAPDLQTD
ncbi:TetR/AcrR family transcriptional regulator [Gordonia westfalica]|uniref:TetR/AcrR family transcriptional regulator n=1 Tax=Gordonia westfalica TaxID=158898 RepID=A0ABU2GY34_9ACTN|nr:TetR/AcrR family transcriptional regulator [Gordonia westfalica]MDS1116372.1 TetR/AcrR family transcriptional regulator [Gordonia westfalica]